MEENSDRLQLQRLAGGNIVKFPPIFSPDASLLFVLTEKVVQVFSAVTGQRTHSLEGAQESIISLEYDILDSHILVACTEGGEVLRWKWLTGTLLSRVRLSGWSDVQYQTFNLINYMADGDRTCAFVTLVKRGNPVQCFVYNTVTGKQLQCPLNLKLGRQRAIVDVDLKNFKYIALAQGPYLYVVNYKTWQWKRLINHFKVRITCVKVHPNEQMVATGDEVGKITLWRQFFNDDIRTALYHWHHNQVTSIAFTQSGSGFFSSGLEAVLVRWNIARPDRRDFVPRISSIILHITTSVQNSNIAISTADNGIQILNIDFKTKCTLQEFTYIFDDKTGQDKFPVGLKMNPRKNALVMNGRSGHLQFYSAYTRNMLYNMDIVGQNQLCMESDKILYNVRVTAAAFNIDWMATVEMYNDEQHLSELRLKFWEYRKENQSYTLNTNIEFPHEKGVRAIEFSSPYHVDNLLCATAGSDNLIKIWSLEDSNNIYKKRKVWFCIGQTSYKNFPVESLTFSNDGSLLAAGFGNALCVYKSENLKLLTVLLPNGVFAGAVNKAQIKIPKANRNGSKNDLSMKKQKIVQLFANLLQTDEETLLKEMKSTSKPKTAREISYVDEAQKKQLFKKIKSMNELNLFQKLALYQKLGLTFQLSEEWHSKVADYIRLNMSSKYKTKMLAKDIPSLNLKARFKAKYRINKFAKRKSYYDKNVTNKLIPMLNMLKVKVVENPPLTNGVQSHVDEETNKNIIPPLQAPIQTNKVIFCHGDFAHLVIACTDKRLLIWNLLTLRLQTVLKISAEHIAIDSLTNLISVFTKNQELYVFLPSVALPLYYRANMPQIHGAVWLPRRYPKSQAVIVNWQARSTLYFLTDNHEIMYLGTDDEIEEPLITFSENADTSLQQSTTFGILASNQLNNAKTNNLPERGTGIGVHGKEAIKSFLDMSTHTMAPLSLLCTDFLKSMIQLNQQVTSTQSKKSCNNREFENNDSSSDENDVISKDDDFKKLNNSKKAISGEEDIDEQYLQQVANETIKIEF